MEEEYEYVMCRSCGMCEARADEGDSYESLPSNFSLGANMLAGAFAGIAVSPGTRALRFLVLLLTAR